MILSLLAALGPFVLEEEFLCVGELRSRSLIRILHGNLNNNNAIQSADLGNPSFF